MEKKKTPLVNWESTCAPKTCGGFGAKECQQLELDFYDEVRMEACLGQGGLMGWKMLHGSICGMYELCE